MNRLKKIIFICLILTFTLALTLTSCSPSDDSGNEGGTDVGGETGDESGNNGENSEGDDEGGDEEICFHTYTETSRTEPSYIHDGTIVYECTQCHNVYEDAIPSEKVIKILAIGHSYSIDSTWYLWDMCKNAGAETVIIGNLYIAGCPLNSHWANIQENAGAYRYYKNTSGEWTTKEGTSIHEALVEEDWDIITLQQGPSASGLPSHYNNLSNIVNYVNSNKTNPDAEIWWHLTWASQQDYMESNDSYDRYDNDQMTMYNAIVSTYSDAVESVIPGKIIPAGTTAQNLRTTYLGDTITRDGYHMSYDIGRYAVALTWYVSLTGGKPEDITWYPDRFPYIKEDIAIIRESVKNAVKAPLSITQSQYPNQPTDEQLFNENGLDINDYELLDFTVTVGAYYDSRTGMDLISDDEEKSPYYSATSLISADDLPKGSVIILNSGYRIDIQSWISASTPTSTATISPISTRFTQINNMWWGIFQLRGFNLSRLSTNTPMTDADSTAIRIYVPKA